MTTLLLIDEETVSKLLTLELAMQAVESAFHAQTQAAGVVFPVVKEPFSETSSFSLKSGYMPTLGTLGVKAAGSWRANPAKGLATVQATILLVSPETGEPLAVIAGKTLTTLRTGAAGGVAAKYLARPDSEILAVIGTGVQGRIQAEAALLARPSLKYLHYVNATGNPSSSFERLFEDRVQLTTCKTAAEAARDADIIISATPAKTPLLTLADVKPGAHINAVGGDARGKREISDDLLMAAERYADSAIQARSIGEHQYRPELLLTEIGAVLSKPPIWNRAAITLFDSTGLAFQDLAAARLVVDAAMKAKVGTTVQWPSTATGQHY
jgi:alanine dehydrogenase